MTKSEQKNYAQIIELIATLKKRLCSTWRSELLDRQAVAELESAISKKKAIIDDQGEYVFDQMLKDFEDWVYEVELNGSALKNPIYFVEPIGTTTQNTNRRTI